MVTVSDIVRDGWTAVPGAIFWVFVVLGLGKAVFRGFLAQELRVRLDHKQGRKLGDIRRVQWELNTGKKFTPEAARNKDAVAAAPTLTESEMVERREFLAQNVRATIWLRGFRYLFDCAFCQEFWAAAMICLVARTPWNDCFPTCLAYAGIGAWLLGRERTTAPAAGPDMIGPAQRRVGPPGPGCGG